MKELEKVSNYTNESFENIKHIDENGNEYWYARELMTILEYSKWENFEKVLTRAKAACENSGISMFEHFPDVRKTIKMPKRVRKRKKEGFNKEIIIINLIKSR